MYLRCILLMHFTWSTHWCSEAFVVAFSISPLCRPLTVSAQPHGHGALAWQPASRGRSIPHAPSLFYTSEVRLEGVQQTKAGICFKRKKKK
jgi:hypothetical protein